jgi:hypothetical protein
MKLHWRNIVVDGVAWRWRMGRSAVVARTAGRTATAKLTVITGLSWADIERARWKGYLHVTPKQIAAWLRKEQS